MGDGEAAHAGGKVVHGGLEFVQLLVAALVGKLCGLAQELPSFAVEKEKCIQYKGKGEVQKGEGQRKGGFDFQTSKLPNFQTTPTIVLLALSL